MSWANFFLFLIYTNLNLYRYSRGAISGSMNIPAATAFDGDGNLILTQEVAMLNSHKPQVKVVVGNRGKGAANVSFYKKYPLKIKLCCNHAFNIGTFK